MPAQKNPFIALILSMVVPGLGQLYNTETAKGLVIAGSCSVLALGTWWLGGLGSVSLGLALLVVWVSADVDAYKTAKAFGHALDWYHRRPYVVAMLLLVGPLALPLLWRSPHFSRAGQWIWTFVVMGGLLLFVTAPYQLSWVVRQVPELKPLLQQSGIHP